MAQNKNTPGHLYIGINRETQISFRVGTEGLSQEKIIELRNEFLKTGREFKYRNTNTNGKVLEGNIPIDQIGSDNGARLLLKIKTAIFTFVQANKDLIKHEEAEELNANLIKAGPLLNKSIEQARKMAEQQSAKQNPAANNQAGNVSFAPTTENNQRQYSIRINVDGMQMDKILQLREKLNQSNTGKEFTISEDSNKRIFLRANFNEGEEQLAGEALGKIDKVVNDKDIGKIIPGRKAFEPKHTSHSPNMVAATMQLLKIKTHYDETRAPTQPYVVHMPVYVPYIPPAQPQHIKSDSFTDLHAPAALPIIEPTGKKRPTANKQKNDDGIIGGAVKWVKKMVFRTALAGGLITVVAGTVVCNNINNTKKGPQPKSPTPTAKTDNTLPPKPKNTPLPKQPIAPKTGQSR